ncbi:MAG: alpha/beta fold hydrolase [Pseudomonadales bacterium]|nr:alpha/beta fold hydrolase [Pseudomonadales bacterium]
MHFVLVHGAWHGGWCWDRLTPLLEAGGASVTAPDLPGAGADETAVEAIDLELYAEHVERWIRELDRPVELVGHSMGGAVISRVAERLPQYLTGLTYLCAFLPRDGESLGQLGAEDADTQLNAALHAGTTAGTLELDAEDARRIFYHDCPAADAELALARLRPQPVAPLRAPVVLSTAAWGSVPRAYVLCTEDRAVSPAQQRRMLERVPCDPVIELATGHSPFHAAPERLAEALLGIAAAR